MSEHDFSDRMPHCGCLDRRLKELDAFRDEVFTALGLTGETYLTSDRSLLDALRVRLGDSYGRALVTKYKVRHTASRGRGRGTETQVSFFETREQAEGFAIINRLGAAACKIEEYQL